MDGPSYTKARGSVTTLILTPGVAVGGGGGGIVAVGGGGGVVAVGGGGAVAVGGGGVVAVGGGGVVAVGGGGVVAVGGGGGVADGASVAVGSGSVGAGAVLDAVGCTASVVVGTLVDAGVADTDAKASVVGDAEEPTATGTGGAGSSAGLPDRFVTSKTAPKLATKRASTITAIIAPTKKGLP